jgi:hypothetical protein
MLAMCLLSLSRNLPIMQPASRSDRTAMTIATVCLWTILAVFAVVYLTGGRGDRKPAGTFRAPRNPTIETPRHPTRDLFHL